MGCDPMPGAWQAPGTARRVRDHRLRKIAARFRVRRRDVPVVPSKRFSKYN